MREAIRFAGWTPKGFIGANRGHDYRTRRASYELHADPQSARVFHRKADATRAVNAMGGGEVIPVKLWFGPYPMPETPADG
jgi:hypothetical protein